MRPLMTASTRSMSETATTTIRIAIRDAYTIFSNCIDGIDDFHFSTNWYQIRVIQDYKGSLHRR